MKMSFKFSLSYLSKRPDQYVISFSDVRFAETISTPTPHCQHTYIWLHPPSEYQDIFSQRASRRHNSITIIPPCMQHMVNIHLTHPDLKQLDHILPLKSDIILTIWDIRLSEEI